MAENRTYTLRSERHRPYNYETNTSVTSMFYRKCITIWNGLPLKTKIDIVSYENINNDIDMN